MRLILWLWLSILIFFDNGKAIALSHVQNDSLVKIMRVVILDTHFCDSELPEIKNVNIKPIQWLNQGHPWPQKCGPTLAKYDHGQKVLNYFLKQLKQTLEINSHQRTSNSELTAQSHQMTATFSSSFQIEITPIVLYEENGDLHEKSWIKAFQFLNEHKIDWALITVGFLANEKKYWNLPQNTKFVMAAPQNEGAVRRAKWIYPQVLVDLQNKNHFLVGEKIDSNQSTLPNPILRYKEKINVWLDEDSSEQGQFRGTSFAAPRFLATQLFL